MSNIAIRVEHLGKQYRIGGKQSVSRNFQETLLASLAAPVRWIRGERKSYETFWALDDVSFEVMHGEAVGIIGRNGAGKSTLLKTLSRITKPTKGRVDLYGRVASLLEVGTGFHSELSGRDNIYLNGAILGMSRREVGRKFDEIVDFAEVEKFLDTPVKHYSSGMYVRLAFAVAAHLEPEILIVDEVLAVGDSEFQKKCLGKMGDVAKEGRTVLFVSHNMSAMTALCTKGILLDHGSIVMNDEITKTVSRYLSNSELRNEYVSPSGTKSAKLHIKRATLLKDGIPVSTFYNSDIMQVQIECVVNKPLQGAQIAFELLTEMDQCIFSSTNLDEVVSKDQLLPGVYIFECMVDLRIFREGKYRIMISSSIPNFEILEILQQPLVFDLLDDSSPILRLAQNRRGLIMPILPWKMSIKNGV